MSQTQLDEWKEVMTKEEWQREVEGIWVEATHTFFPMDLIVACVDPELGNPDSPAAYIEDIEKVTPRTETQRTLLRGLRPWQAS